LISPSGSPATTRSQVSAPARWLFLVSRSLGPRGARVLNNCFHQRCMGEALCLNRRIKLPSFGVRSSFIAAASRPYVSRRLPFTSIRETAKKHLTRFSPSTHWPDMAKREKRTLSRHSAATTSPINSIPTFYVGPLLQLCIKTRRYRPKKAKVPYNLRIQFDS
jgi:hypothetical protein